MPISRDSYVAARALITLFGNAPADRQRMYNTFDGAERHRVRRQLGAWHQGARIMRHFEHNDEDWLIAIAHVMEMRREHESAGCNNPVASVGDT